MEVIQELPDTYERFLATFDRLEASRPAHPAFAIKWQDWKERVTLRARRCAFFGRDLDSGDGSND